MFGIHTLNVHLRSIIIILFFLVALKNSSFFGHIFLSSLSFSLDAPYPENAKPFCNKAMLKLSKTSALKMPAVVFGMILLKRSDDV